MKFSKSQIRSNYHTIPPIYFEDTRLTSYSGLVIFQALFTHINIKKRLAHCFRHLGNSPIFSRHLIVYLLIIHLLLGYRRLREIEYYKDDPLVQRVMGLNKLPDVSTISRALSQMDMTSVDKIRSLSRSLVTEGLIRERFKRLTLDFDGSVLSTTRHAEGTAVGFNPRRKGARSYYPLFCTVAQTAQFFDVYHRSGNVHDSTGAIDFIKLCVGEVRKHLPDAIVESRVDSAFFEKEILETLDDLKVEFSATVPFTRMGNLKEMIENCTKWKRVNKSLSVFDMIWKPRRWKRAYRFIFVRKKVQQQRKEPLQLDLFEPRDFNYDYKVIVTNKRNSAKSVIHYHDGRGSQEGIFANARQDTGLGIVPTFNLEGNQTYTLCSMMAHNLAHELQMLRQQRSIRSLPKRPSAWTFQTLGTLRHRIIQRAGRLTRPQGQLTLTMSANETVKRELLQFIDSIN